MAAIGKVQELEAIQLDPIYTGKAFAVLIDLAAKNELEGKDPFIFLHTGEVLGS